MATRPMQGERYSSVAIAFHWVIAAMVIVNLAIGLLHESVPALRAWMGAHKAIGLTVLVLSVLRVLWRVGHRAPPPPADIPAWQQTTARATHWLLYALLLLMPLTGWMMVSGGETRRPMSWFGLFDMPFLPVGKAAGDLGHSAHGLLGWLMLALVVLHIGAALRHHFILRDHILGRMLPAAR